MRRAAAPKHALGVSTDLKFYLAFAPPVAALFRAYSRMRGSADPEHSVSTTGSSLRILAYARKHCGEPPLPYSRLKFVRIYSFTSRSRRLLRLCSAHTRVCAEVLNLIILSKKDGAVAKSDSPSRSGGFLSVCKPIRLYRPHSRKYSRAFRRRR